MFRKVTIKDWLLCKKDSFRIIMLVFYSLGQVTMNYIVLFRNLSKLSKLFYYFNTKSTSISASVWHSWNLAKSRGDISKVSMELA
jgi:hypothetical protein